MECLWAKGAKVVAAAFRRRTGQSFKIQCISNDAAVEINILLPTLRLPAITKD